MAAGIKCTKLCLKIKVRSAIQIVNLVLAREPGSSPPPPGVNLVSYYNWLVTDRPRPLTPHLYGSGLQQLVTTSLVYCSFQGVKLFSPDFYRFTSTTVWCERSLNRE